MTNYLDKSISYISYEESHLDSNEENDDIIKEIEFEYDFINIKENYQTKSYNLKRMVKIQ